MSLPRRTIVTYNAKGEVALIDHRTVQPGTMDFGDGPEPTEREHQDNLPQQLISPATKTALAEFLDALEIDVAAERQRIATAAQAEADRTASAAAVAASAAADLVESTPPPSSG